MEIINKEGVKYVVPDCIEVEDGFSGVPICSKAGRCSIRDCTWVGEIVERRATTRGRWDNRPPGRRRGRSRL